MWTRRDHAAEWKQWTAMLEHIDGRVQKIPGVKTVISQPNGLSNRTPSLRVLWEPAAFDLASDAAARLLLGAEPRIAVGVTREADWRVVSLPR
jgi:L-seryl-tRNA(Ser) seleniumtransferase